MPRANQKSVVLYNPTMNTGVIANQRDYEGWIEAGFELIPEDKQAEALEILAEEPQEAWEQIKALFPKKPPPKKPPPKK